MRLKNLIRKTYKIGQSHRCPECGFRSARIVWISEDKKTIGVQCPKSHFIKVERRAGYDREIWKKDCVMLIDLENKT